MAALNSTNTTAAATALNTTLTALNTLNLSLANATAANLTVPQIVSTANLTANQTLALLSPLLNTSDPNVIGLLNLTGFFKRGLRDEEPSQYSTLLLLVVSSAFTRLSSIKRQLPGVPTIPGGISLQTLQLLLNLPPDIAQILLQSLFQQQLGVLTGQVLPSLDYCIFSCCSP